MPCVDTIARYLFYAFIIDFSLETLDLIHRIYEADESFHTLDFMVKTRLYLPHIIVQIVIGTLVPLGLLALTQLVSLTARARRAVYAVAGVLTLVGIFAMRWNVVIGGQLFSKSFLGYTTYKMEFATQEGLLMAIALMVLPFLILWALVRLLPPWHEASRGAGGPARGLTPRAHPARRRSGAEAPGGRPMAERTSAALESVVEELTARLARLEVRVAELEARPAAAGGHGRGGGLRAGGSPRPSVPQGSPGARRPHAARPRGSVPRPGADRRPRPSGGGRSRSRPRLRRGLPAPRRPRGARRTARERRLPRHREQR